jgi:hypothetical protein
MKRLAGSLAVVAVAFTAAPAHALKVTTLVQKQASRPSISADGSQIVVESYNDIDPANEDGYAEGLDDGGGTFRINAATGAASRVARPLYNEKGEFSVFVRPLTSVLAPDGITVAGDAQRIWVTGVKGDNDSVIATTTGRVGERVIGSYGSASPPRIALSRDGAHVAWDNFAGSGYTLFFDGRQIAANGFEPSLSWDGRRLVYTRQLSPTSFQVRVRDTTTNKDRLVSSDSKGKAGQGYGAMISGDGRWVSFRSTSVLVPGARNWVHVYVKDLKTGKTKVASLTAKDHQAKGLEAKFLDPFSGKDATQISSDGRFVAFESRAPLVKGDKDIKPDLFVKDMVDGPVVQIPVASEDGVSGGWFRLSANGRWLTYVEDDTSLKLVSLTGESPSCELPSPHPDEGLTGVDRAIVNDELRPTPGEAAAAEKALSADTRAHPGNRAANANLLAELRAMQKRYGPVGSTSAGDDELAKLVDDAKCKLLDEGHDTLSKYLDAKGHGDKLALAERLLKLKDVLKGDADIAERQQILKDTIADFIEKLAGKDKAKKYAGEANEAYKLLESWVSGTLSKDLKASIQKRLLTQLKSASRKWFGDDAPELVDRLLDLRDVLAGSVDDKKRAKMLEDSVAALGQKLLGKTLLNSPQVRAAMFGWELGRAFGNRIAADLELIANKALANDCAVALGPSQSNPGAIDYSQPARGIVPKPLWHEGWECVVLPDAFVPASAGGMVQATRPADASRKDKILWGITTTGSVVEYDPSYSR